MTSLLDVSLSRRECEERCEKERKDVCISNSVCLDRVLWVTLSKTYLYCKYWCDVCASTWVPPYCSSLICPAARLLNVPSDISKAYPWTCQPASESRKPPVQANKRSVPPCLPFQSVLPRACGPPRVRACIP